MFIFCVRQLVSIIISTYQMPSPPRHTIAYANSCCTYQVFKLCKLMVINCMLIKFEKTGPFLLITYLSSWD